MCCQEHGTRKSRSPRWYTRSHTLDPVNYLRECPPPNQATHKCCPPYWYGKRNCQCEYFLCFFLFVKKSFSTRDYDDLICVRLFVVYQPSKFVQFNRPGSKLMYHFGEIFLNKTFGRVKICNIVGDAISKKTSSFSKMFARKA